MCEVEGITRDGEVGGLDVSGEDGRSVGVDGEGPWLVVAVAADVGGEHERVTGCVESGDPSVLASVVGPVECVIGRREVRGLGRSCQHGVSGRKDDDHLTPVGAGPADVRGEDEVPAVRGQLRDERVVESAPGFVVRAGSRREVRREGRPEEDGRVVFCHVHELHPVGRGSSEECAPDDPRSVGRQLGRETFAEGGLR